MTGHDGDPVDDTPKNKNWDRTDVTTATVRQTYDRIAEHFAKTREYPWPEVESFVTAVERQSDGHGLGLDVGCGNGRHLRPLLERVDHAIGVDVSRAVLSTAVDRVGGTDWRARITLLQAEATRLPLRTGVVDLAVYVATLHHLPTRERRTASLDELARVLAGGAAGENAGRALVGVWSTEHEKFSGRGDDGEGFDTTVDWTLPDGEVVPRYYHVYEPSEFERDLAASDLRVERTYVSSGNCYASVAGTTTGQDRNA